ncbi:MAG: hypothetical protein ACK5JH_12230 [Anaerocolumna sp.]
MICKACGRSTENESANYCEYCGTSYRDSKNVINDSVERETIQSNELKEAVTDKENKDTSFKNWLGSMLLPFIPGVGVIIYIVMLFVWSFSSETPKSKKNWARASLIVGVIGIIFIIYILMSTTMDLINSGFDFNGYMNEINSIYQ